MKASRFGANTPAALQAFDPTKPGGGCSSEIINDSSPHSGIWFAIMALGVAGSTAILNFVSTSVKTLNGVPPSVAATGLIPGQFYTILSLGNTDFTAVGASNNAVGIGFEATAAGTGTGTAVTESRLFTGVQIPAGTIIYGEFQQITLQNGAVIAYKG